MPYTFNPISGTLDYYASLEVNGSVVLAGSSDNPFGVGSAAVVFGPANGSDKAIHFAPDGDLSGNLNLEIYTEQADIQFKDDGSIHVDAGGGFSVTGDVLGSGRVAGATLGVGNSAAATSLGSVIKKIEIFNGSGVSLGFIPVYNSIT